MKTVECDLLDYITFLNFRKSRVSPPNTTESEGGWVGVSILSLFPLVQKTTLYVRQGGTRGYMCVRHLTRTSTVLPIY